MVPYLVAEGQEEWVEEHEVAKATGRVWDWSEGEGEGFSDYSSEDSLEISSDEDDLREEEVEEHEVGDADIKSDVESDVERVVNAIEEKCVVMGEGQGV